MAKEASRTVRIGHMCFVKLWNHQLRKMEREGRKTSMQDLLAEGVELLLEQEKK